MEVKIQCHNDNYICVFHTVFATEQPYLPYEQMHWPSEYQFKEIVKLWPFQVTLHASWATHE